MVGQVKRGASNSGVPSPHVAWEPRGRVLLKVLGVDFSTRTRAPDPISDQKDIGFSTFLSYNPSSFSRQNGQKKTLSVQTKTVDIFFSIFSNKTT